MVGYTLRNTLSDFGYVCRGICERSRGWTLLSVNEQEHVFKDGSSDGFIGSDGEKYPLTGNELVSMNFWGVHPSIFEHMKFKFHAFLREQGDRPKAEFYIPKVVDRILSDQVATVRIFPTD